MVGGKKFKHPKAIIFHATQLEREHIVKPALLESGLLGHEDLWVSETGIGKANAAAVAAALLSRYATPETLCINVGVCEGNRIALNHLPCVQIERVYDGDFDMHLIEGAPYMKPYLDISSTALPHYVCYSQDRYSSSLDEVFYEYGLTEETVDSAPMPICLPIDSDKPFYVDRELYGVALACGRLKQSLVAIKSVRSIVGGKYQGCYEGVGYTRACKRAVAALSAVLRRAFK